jgi:hypothetical protein
MTTDQVDFAMVGIGTDPIPLSANAAKMAASLSALVVFHLYLWQVEA